MIDRRRHSRESDCGEQADDTDDGDVPRQPRSAHAVLSQQCDFLFEGDQHDSLSGDHDHSAGDDDAASVEQTVETEAHTMHRRRLQATSGSRQNARPDHDRGEDDALGQVDDARMAKDCPESVPLHWEPVAGRHPDEVDVGTQTQDYQRAHEPGERPQAGEKLAVIPFCSGRRLGAFRPTEYRHVMTSAVLQLKREKHVS